MTVRRRGKLTGLSEMIPKVYPAGEPDDARALRVFGAYCRSVPERVLKNARPVRFRDAGDAFLEAYLPVAERRRGLPYGEHERAWQEYRRGRYVEFNLLYDRGTLFGLKTGGRTESILMSLPPVVRYCYDYRPEPGSREAELLDYLRPRDWAAG